MAWRTVTEADLLQKMSSVELQSLRSTGLGDDQGDPIAGHIAQLVDFVRGYIRANPKNTLGAIGTLPEALILPAVDYLLVDVSSRNAGILIDLNETRKTARADALRLFRDVANGSFAIEQPDDTTEIASTGADVEQVTPVPVNDATRDTMKGL